MVKQEEKNPWGFFRARTENVEKVERYFEKHRAKLADKYNIHSIPDFVAYVLKEYMRYNR